MTEGVYPVGFKLICNQSIKCILRNRKHVPSFYRVIETRVEVWENEPIGEFIHSFFEFSQTFTRGYRIQDTGCLDVVVNRLDEK